MGRSQAGVGASLLLPFQLILFSLIFLFDSLVFCVVWVVFLPIRVGQVCGFALPSPYKIDKRLRSEVILLTSPKDNGPFMDDDLADKLEQVARTYAKKTQGRIRCMISDQRLGEELAGVVKTPAEKAFWKAMWKYPNSQLLESGPKGVLHYHALLAVRRDTSSEDDSATFESFKKSLQELGLVVRTYPVSREKLSEQIGDDHHERYARIAIGQSTVWKLSTMQQIALYEAVMIWTESTATEIRKRVMYWTSESPKDLPKNERPIAYFSYEAHCTLEEMLFENWVQDFDFYKQFYYLASGFLSILYSGMTRTAILKDVNVSYSELRRHMGPFLATMCKLQMTCCGQRESASNQAILARSNVFDYRPGRSVA